MIFSGMMRGPETPWRRAWRWLTSPPPGNPDRYPPIPSESNMTGLGWAGRQLRVRPFDPPQPEDGTWKDR